MQKLFEMKGYLTKYYAKYSKIVDKTIQFALALLTFTFINQNIIRLIRIYSASKIFLMIKI